MRALTRVGRAKPGRDLSVAEALRDTATEALVADLKVLEAEVAGFARVLRMDLGGPIPIDTAPAPVQLLHAVLPVPRAADALATLTLGGAVGSPWADAAVVLLWGAAGLVATALAARRRQRLSPDQLRRSVEESTARV